MVAPHGSNVLGGLLDPYRSVLGTPRPVPGSRHSTVPSWSGPRPYGNGLLGSTGLVLSGQGATVAAKLLLCYCIFGSSHPVARASPGSSGPSVG